MSAIDPKQEEQEELVADWLRATPGFFERYANLLNEIRLKHPHDIARMQNPEVLAVRSKVQLISDPALSQFLPVRVAIVEIELKDGSILTERVDAVRGTLAIQWAGMRS